MKRVYRIDNAVVEHDPSQIPRVIQLGTVRKAIKHVALTRKKHFNGIPFGHDAVNCTLAHLGATARVTPEALLCVDGSKLTTSKKYGKSTLREWVLDALLAEERHLKIERTTCLTTPQARKTLKTR